MTSVYLSQITHKWYVNELHLLLKWHYLLFFVFLSFVNFTLSLTHTLTFFEIVIVSVNHFFLPIYKLIYVKCY